MILIDTIYFLSILLDGATIPNKDTQNHTITRYPVWLIILFNFGSDLLASDNTANK